MRARKKQAHCILLGTILNFLTLFYDNSSYLNATVSIYRGGNCCTLRISGGFHENNVTAQKKVFLFLYAKQTIK